MIKAELRMGKITSLGLLRGLGPLTGEVFGKSLAICKNNVPLMYVTLIRLFHFPVPDVYFTVRQTISMAVPLNDTITFNHVISNVGGGYVSSGDDNGKFIVPVNGKRTRM